MRLVHGVSYWAVVVKLDKLNKARRVFEETTDEGIRRKADVEFAECYDWLMACNVSIDYEEGPQLWILRPC